MEATYSFIASQAPSSVFLLTGTNVLLLPPMYLCYHEISDIATYVQFDDSEWLRQEL